MSEAKRTTDCAACAEVKPALRRYKISKFLAILGFAVYAGSLHIDRVETSFLFFLLSVVLTAPWYICIFRFRNFRLSHAIKDEQYHKHLGLERVLKVGDKSKIFDLSDVEPRIEEPVTLLSGKMKIVGGTPNWRMIRVKGRLAISDLAGEIYVSPVQDYLRFWLLRPARFDFVLAELAESQARRETLEREVDRVVADRNEWRQKAEKAYGCIEYMLAGIAALKQRIEESRTSRPKHTCPIAVPIKEKLDRIAQTPSGETRRGLDFTNAKMADRVNSWLNNMSPLVGSKTPKAAS